MEIKVDRETPSADWSRDVSSVSLPFSTRTLRSFHEAQWLASDWDQLVVANGANVYMTFDWCRVWWEFYGKENQLRIFLFYSGNTLVGVLPIYFQDLLFKRFRVARLVGANVPPKLFEPPIISEFAERAFSAAIQQLFGEDQCDLISIGPVSDLDSSGPAFFEAAARLPDKAGKSEKVSYGVHTIFHLPESYDAYLSGLSKNEKKSRRKYELRTLEKEFDTKLDVLSDPAQLDDEFTRFVAQHAVQWQAEGKPGHFGAWPNAEDYNRELVRTQGALGRVRFIRIIANGKVISNQYTFALGDRYIWELPSREVGEEWERFSLGRTGVATMIKAAIEEKKTRLEGGLGHYEYKLRLNAEERATWIYRVLSARPGAEFRYKCFRAARKVVEWVVHKIWYRRLQKFFPKSMRRPQPRIWLHLDA